jgi:hypothetical protein
VIGTERSESGKGLILDAFAGVLSGLLYMSYVLSFAFLIPVQRTIAARGKRSGLVSAGAAFAVIAASEFGRMAEIKSFGFGNIAAGTIPPLVFLGAVFLVNWSLGRMTSILRIFVVSMLLSLVAAPFVIPATLDKGFLSWLTEYFTSLAGAKGLDASLAEQLDSAVVSAAAILRNGFSAFILWMLAGSWWMGNRLASKTALGYAKAEVTHAELPGLAGVRAPAIALWPTLATWTGLFIVLVTRTEGILQTIAWNLALCLASLYAAQGLGIISHYFARKNALRVFRLLAPLAVMVALLNSTIGVALLIALPLMGISEVWIPYRNMKGASK